MEGGKKKRKIEEEDDEEVQEEDYDEEEKIEQFFALIKSTREVRDRIAVAAAGNRGKSAGDKASGTWNPTFKLEDFMEAPPPEKAADADRAGPSSAVGEGGVKREGDSDDEKPSTAAGDKGLDLNLSL